MDPLATFTVEVTPASDTLTSLGQRVQLLALVRNGRGERIRRAAVIWVSSDDSVATVSPQGLVTATGNGVARITATVAGLSDTAALTVRQQVTGFGFAVQPASAVAGEAIAPAVVVEFDDAGGSPVADAVAPVTLTLGSNPGGATLSGTTTGTTVGGAATFSDLWLDKAAAGFTLVATTPGQNPATSNGFTVAPGAPLLAFLTQPGTAEGQVPFDPPVRVMAKEDKFGNAVGNIGVTVALWTNPTGEALRGYTTESAVDGVATFHDVHLALPGDGFVLEASSGAAMAVRSEPFSVRLTFAQAVTGAGAEHTCGLTVATFTYCWGANAHGELGYGTDEQRRTPVPVGWYFKAVQLSAGEQVTCGVTSDYGAYCWGSNGAGQLGNGTNLEQRLPARVAGPPIWTQVSTSGRHTCGVTLEHDAYCWGSNTYGQLGDSTTAARLSPAPVSGGLDFAQVSAGPYHTCGLTTASLAYCWGWNSYGALGDGTTDDQRTPTLVQGGLSFVQVSAGGTYTCGVTNSHTAYCWGGNVNGQLGDGTSQGRPQPTLVSGGLSFDRVSAAWGHTCGLTTGGDVYCWGNNFDGQVGDGSTVWRLEPTLVTGGLTFVQVSTGFAHSCGVTTERVAYCWGRNERGQLGNGSTDRKLTPTPVIH